MTELFEKYKKWLPYAAVILVLVGILIGILISNAVHANSRNIPVIAETAEPETETTPEPTPSPTPTPKPTPTPAPTPVPEKKLSRDEFVFDEKVWPVYTGNAYDTCYGIDVSEHQFDIDWEKVVQSGVEFAYIRCGWRGYTKGHINEDTYFRQNIEGAKAAGLKVGVYFFAQAINTKEAVEEAEYTLELIKDYEMDLPVVYDWEKISSGSIWARTNRVRVKTATACANAYCDVIREAGYQTGLYCIGDAKTCAFDLSKIDVDYYWFFLSGEFPNEWYDNQMWQFNVSAKMDGITTDVDLNLLMTAREGVLDGD